MKGYLALVFSAACFLGTPHTWAGWVSFKVDHEGNSGVLENWMGSNLIDRETNQFVIDTNQQNTLKIGWQKAAEIISKNYDKHNNLGRHIGFLRGLKTLITKSLNKGYTCFSSCGRFDDKASLHFTMLTAANQATEDAGFLALQAQCPPGNLLYDTLGTSPGSAQWLSPVDDKDVCIKNDQDALERLDSLIEAKRDRKNGK